MIPPAAHVGFRLPAPTDVGVQAGIFSARKPGGSATSCGGDCGLKLPLDRLSVLHPQSAIRNPQFWQVVG